MSTLDEFYESYDQPKIGDVIVGFSGIDPLPKSLGSGTTQDTAQNVGSNNDGETVTIDHEGLDGLLGGNEEGHYHMTQAEHNKLGNYPVYEQLNGKLKHDELAELHGGNYHLTEAEHDNIVALLTSIGTGTLSDLIDARITEYMTSHASSGETP